MSRQLLSDHQLFHFNTCPFCIKVRLALWSMGLKVPLKNIKLNPNNKAELVAGGGKKQVPCLRIQSADGGVAWLYESTDIINYLKTEFAA